MIKKEIIISQQIFQNQLICFLVIVIIAFFFFAPSLEYLPVDLHQPMKETAQDYFLRRLSGDPGALSFVQKNLPAKSVILADENATKVLSVMTGNYMAYNVGSAYEERFNWVFDPTTPDSEKVNIVTSPEWAIDYIYLADPTAEGQHFRLHPEIYQKIYDGQTIIYQVTK